MNSRLAKLAWIGFEKIGITLISIVTFLVYAKVLGPNSFGEAILAISVAQALSMLISNLFEDSLVRHVSPEKSHFNTAFSIGLLLSGLSCFLVLISLFLFSVPERQSYLILISLAQIPFVVCSSVYVAFYRRNGLFKTLAQRTVLARLCGALVGLVMIYLGMGAEAIVAQAITAELLSLGVLVVKGGLNLRFQFQINILLELLKIGWAVSARRLSWDVLVRGMPVILGATAGAGAVGIYGLAWRLVDMPRSAILGGLAGYALPVFSRRQGRPSEVLELYRLATKYTSLLISPLFIGLALLAPGFVSVVFGEQWKAAVLPLQILALLAALSVMRFYVPIVLTAIGKPSVNIGLDFVGTALAVICVVLFSPEYGAVAVSVSLLIRTLLILPISVYSFQLASGISALIQIKALLVSLLGIGMMSLSILLFNSNYSFDDELLKLVLNISLGILVYALSITIVAPRWVKELKSFIRY